MTESGITPKDDLQIQVDNLVYVLNMVRDGTLKDDSLYEAILAATGIKQCCTCRKALSSSTDANAPEKPACKSCYSPQST